MMMGTPLQSSRQSGLKSIALSSGGDSGIFLIDDETLYFDCSHRIPAAITVDIGEERRCNLRGPYTEILLPPERT
jgi:hypothetical protein